MKKLLIFTAVAALATVSFAQGGGRMMRFGGGGGLRMALRDDVSKELGLTADQKSKLQDASDKEREEMRAQFQNAGGGNGNDGGGQPDFAAMRKRMEERQAKEKEILAGILNADQQKRLKELTIQRQGNMAIADAEVQSDLKMTDAQKQQVADLQQKQMDAMRTVMEKIRNQELDFQSARPIFEKNQKIMSDELIKILTDDQKKQFATMGGKPFTFDTAEDQRGPGGQ